MIPGVGLLVVAGGPMAVRYSSHSGPPLPPPSPRPAPLATEVGQADPEAVVAGAASAPMSEADRLAAKQLEDFLQLGVRPAGYRLERLSEEAL
jgi:hypothetical protein